MSYGKVIHTALLSVQPIAGSEVKP